MLPNAVAISVGWVNVSVLQAVCFSVLYARLLLSLLTVGVPHLSQDPMNMSVDDATEALYKSRVSFVTMAVKAFEKKHHLGIKRKKGVAQTWDIAGVLSKSLCGAGGGGCGVDHASICVEGSELYCQQRESMRVIYEAYPSGSERRERLVRHAKSLIDFGAMARTVQWGPADDTAQPPPPPPA